MRKNILFYTFRTFPFIDELKKIDPEVVVLRKLKEDLKIVFQRIEFERPEYVIGVAIGKKTEVEGKACNLFNKTKKVVADAPEFYALTIPDFLSPFPHSFKGSNSFCNWSMFQISHFIATHQLATKLCFIHISAKDIYKLTELLNS